MNEESFEKDRKKIRIASILIIAIGLAVMAGWFFDIGFFKTVLPGLPPMEFITASCFILAGISLCILSGKMKYFLPWKAVSIACGIVIVFFMGSAFIASASTSSNYAPDLEKNFVDSTGPEHGGIDLYSIPSIGTSFNFLLISAMIFWITIQREKAVKFTKSLSLLVFGIGLVAIAGYALDIPQLYFSLENISTGMAVHSALLFVFTGFCFWSYSIEYFLLENKQNRGEI